MPVALAIGAFAVSVGSMAYQASQAEDAEDAQYAANEERKRQATIQNDYQNRLADIKNVRAQRDAIRKSRVMRSQVINAAANSGTTGSSGASGAVSSIGSQTADNLGYFQGVRADQRTTSGLVFDSQAREISAVNQAGKAQSNMATAGAIGSLSSTIFAGAGGFKTIFE